MQLPSLVTLQVTVCKPTPKFPPVRATFPPPTESQQVTLWPSVLVAVISLHLRDTIELPPGMHWSSTLGRDSTGVAVQESHSTLLIQTTSRKCFFKRIFPILMLYNMFEVRLLRSLQLFKSALKSDSLPVTLNVKDPVPVQLPSLVTLQVTVCKPTPKFPPVRATFPPPTESKQVTLWPSVLVAVT